VKLSDLPAEVLAPISHLLGDRDPASIEFPAPTGWFVLVLQYVRPDAKTLPGGGKLYFADQTKKEDEFQGRVGVVLALGPDAYKDPGKYPAGPWVTPGDWVMWPALESAAQRQRYGGFVIAVLPDDRIVARNVDPLQSLEAA
jgi:hypothetical protein